MAVDERFTELVRAKGDRLPGMTALGDAEPDLDPQVPQTAPTDQLWD